MKLKLTKYHVATQPFIDTDQFQKRVVFITRTARVKVIDNAYWKLIELQSLDSLPIEVVSDLVNNELLVPWDEDELSTILSRNRKAINNDYTLNITIQPTQFCQFNCDYCGQEHTPQMLGSEYQDKLIERINLKLGEGKYKVLHIGWFGAEPLAALSVIRSLSIRLRTLAKIHSCAYISSIVTNGLALTEAIANELIHDHLVRTFNLTLDGTAVFHDARRHLKNGKSTFERIFSNLVLLAKNKPENVVIKLRTNVDYRNHKGVSALIHMLAESGIQDKVDYYVAPVYSWGNDAHKLSLEPAVFADLEVGWLAEMIQLGFKVNLLPSPTPIVCVAVKPTSELIDANGNLFNCTEVSYVPSYGTPNKYSIGHLKDGEITGKREILGDFNDRIGKGDYSCSTCEMLPVCGGVCPKAWLEGTQRCPTPKYNLKERLLLNHAIHNFVETA
jgi:uncharacterized protein